MAADQMSRAIAQEGNVQTVDGLLRNLSASKDALDKAYKAWTESTTFRNAELGELRSAVQKLRDELERISSSREVQEVEEMEWS